jgi:drug/metabolite transporter (DMT)-like permease
LIAQFEVAELGVRPNTIENGTKCLTGSRIDLLDVGLTGIFVRLLPSLSPLTVTAGRLFVALTVVLPILGLFRESRQSFKSAMGRPIAYVLALLLAGYYLLATAAFQMAPVAEVALLLSTPPLFYWLSAECMVISPPTVKSVAPC